MAQANPSALAPAFAGRHEPKPLPFDPGKLTGLSERLIRSHWENNYCGALKALNVIELRLAAMLDDPDLPPYVYGDLKREELLRTGSVRLHELYFANLGGDGKPGQAMEQIVGQAFGSYSRWESAAARYVDAFMHNVHWEEVARRLVQATAPRAAEAQETREATWNPG
jgi:Fe-Mn family superoxide dismutase